MTIHLSRTRAMLYDTMKEKGLREREREREREKRNLLVAFLAKLIANNDSGVSIGPYVCYVQCRLSQQAPFKLKDAMMNTLATCTQHVVGKVTALPRFIIWELHCRR